MCPILTSQAVSDTAQSSSVRTHLLWQLDLIVISLESIILFRSGPTIVKCFQFITGNLCIVHTLQQRVDPGIFLSPEIVCDCPDQPTVNLDSEEAATNRIERPLGLRRRWAPSRLEDFMVARTGMEIVCVKIQWVAGVVGESRVLGSRFLVDR